MKRITLFWMLLPFLSMGAIGAQEVQEEEPASAAIKQQVQSYVTAFNNKDLDALLKHWSPDGVYIEPANGVRIEGTEALKASYEAEFKANPNSRIESVVNSIEFVSPGVAIEQGTSKLIYPDEEPMVSNYSAVHVKRNGGWVLDRISERTVVVPPSHYEQLKVLEWMIGNWEDAAGEGTVITECHWARNKNFMVRSFTASIAGVIELTGMQIIGWDPATKTIRSWTFDSDGGFNQGTWTQQGESWSLQVAATMPDGSLASSTSVFRPLDENRFTWKQTNRIVDGNLLPNLDEVVIQRRSEN